MRSAVAPGDDLGERLSALDPAIVPASERHTALERFFATPSRRERAGRYWKIDLENVVPPAGAVASSAGARIQNTNSRIVACDLVTAARDHAELLRRVLGATEAGTTKFGAIARAFAHAGAFVYVPAGVCAGEPIAISYDVPAGATIFPYTVVLAERGAQATVIERMQGGDDDASVFGATEIVTEENADITYAAYQNLAAGARAFQTRIARPGRDATVSWAIAEIGSALTVTELGTTLAQPGADARTVALFFPNARQHVDVVSTVDHQVGDTTSETIVKTAAVESGQGRYLGNIKIAPHAQGSNASLRDDALLLSPKAHVDSVPALEIGANDVKAYHGATVGALDADQIFYMESRGIERNAAERMIALGFFEPGIERFPTEALREEIRTAVAAKLAS